MKTSLCSDLQCPIQHTINLIGGKWSIPILRQLFSGSRRTHEFLETLPGLSSKTLLARLRELEEHGLVHRKIYPEIPPHVEYSLTDKGRRVQPVLIALHQVGQQWLAQDACTCPLLHDGAVERGQGDESVAQTKKLEK
jgi:DNA-binding HxlR family transcriptional regulator